MLPGFRAKDLFREAIAVQHPAKAMEGVANRLAFPGFDSHAHGSASSRLMQYRIPGTRDGRAMMTRNPLVAHQGSLIDRERIVCWRGRRRSLRQGGATY